MRDHARVGPRFWVGETGRKLRGHPEAQLVALYLMTCPSSNMIGLYHVAIPTLAHETGLTTEGASKGLKRVREVGFAHYDETTETVWIPAMALHQVGESLGGKDKRIKGVANQAIQFRKCPFYWDFLRIYGEAYSLGGQHSSDLIRRDMQAPSKPLRSKEQEQEQEQESLSSREPPSAPDDDDNDEPPWGAVEPEPGPSARSHEHPAVAMERSLRGEGGVDTRRKPSPIPPGIETELLELWAAHSPPLAPCTQLTPPLRKMLRERLATEEAWSDGRWREAIALCAERPGSNGEGNRGYRLTLPKFLEGDAVRAVLEDGKYSRVGRAAEMSAGARVRL